MHVDRSILPILDVDFDFSEVIFIATANVPGTVLGPLRDRMEIIHIDGYTELEKLQIAKRHLVPRQLKAHGLREDEVTLMDDAVLKIIFAPEQTREPVWGMPPMEGGGTPGGRHPHSIPQACH